MKNERKAPPASLLASLVVVGLILVASAACDVSRGFTTFSGGGQRTKGITITKSVDSGPIAAGEEPVLFWGYVLFRLGLGLPALLWGGFHFFVPERNHK